MSSTVVSPAVDSSRCHAHSFDSAVGSSAVGSSTVGSSAVVVGGRKVRGQALAFWSSMVESSSAAVGSAVGSSTVGSSAVGSSTVGNSRVLTARFRRNKAVSIADASAVGSSAVGSVVGSSAQPSTQSSAQSSQQSSAQSSTQVASLRAEATEFVPKVEEEQVKAMVSAGFTPEWARKWYRGSPHYAAGRRCSYAYLDPQFGAALWLGQENPEGVPVWSSDVRSRLGPRLEAQIARPDVMRSQATRVSFSDAVEICGEDGSGSTVARRKGARKAFHIRRKNDEVREALYSRRLSG